MYWVPLPWALMPPVMMMIMMRMQEGTVASARELWEEVKALVQVDRLVAALEALEDLDTRLAVEHDR